MFYANVAELLLLNVRRYPDKTAMVYGTERLTYREFNDRVNRIVRMLQGFGIRPGDKIAYMLPNRPELIEIYYAIQKIGAVAVALNFRLIPCEIARLVHASGSKMLLFDSRFLDRISAVHGEMADTGIFIEVDGFAPADEYNQTEWVHLFSDVIGDSAALEPTLFRDATALSRIQFTGGSTGLPKGVMRTHGEDIAEIVGVMLSSGLATEPGHVVLVQCPLEHHGGHSWFSSTFASGGELVICGRFNARHVLSLIESERVTHVLLLPPSTYLRLLEIPEVDDFDLSSVVLVQSAAGATTPEIVKTIYRHFSRCIVNYGWGQTEAGLGSSLVLTREMSERNRGLIESIGRPMPFIEMRIVDDDGNEVPAGGIGECLVAGPAVMSGYYGQPELTSQAFSDGWLHTGDMMQEDEEGYLYLKSRKKDMIKSGGENVFAQEVENVVRLHPAVEDCAVIGLPDELMGESVTAVVELRRGETLTLTELQRHCRKYVSSYKKPRKLILVDRIERDDAGKIRKDRIVQSAEETLTEEGEGNA